MASFLTRKNSVRVTIKHKYLSKPLVKSFSKHDNLESNKKDAVVWAESQHAKLTLDQLVDMAESKKIPFDFVLVKYRDLITSKKTSTTKDRELSKIRVVRSQVTGYTTKELNETHTEAQPQGYSLADISDKFICNYIHKRMVIDKVCWETVDKELQVFANVLEAANILWAYVVHPKAKSDGIKLFDALHPNIAREAVHRDRRVELEEYKLICGDDSKYSLIAQFAIETAMRRGEIANIKICNYNSENHTLKIPKSKTDKKQRVKGRTIPLSKKAREIFLKFAYDRNVSCSLLSCSDPKSLSQGWDRLATKLNICDLRFHDFRHEGTSRFFEKGLSIEQVALITGHSSWKSLERYTQLRPENLVAILD